MAHNTKWLWCFKTIYFLWWSWFIRIYIKTENDTLFTQKLFTFTPRKRNFFKACHIECIQWYAALGPIGLSGPACCFVALLLDGLGDAARMSVGACGYVDQVFCPIGKYSMKLLIWYHNSKTWSVTNMTWAIVDARYYGRNSSFCHWNGLFY